MVFWRAMDRASRLNCPKSELDWKRTVVTESEMQIAPFGCRRAGGQGTNLASADVDSAWNPQIDLQA